MQLLNPLYWFTLEPANVEGLLGYLALGIFLLLCLVGVFAHFKLVKGQKDRYKKMIGKKLSFYGFVLGFSGLILFFFGYENIHFFGARFWFPVWFVVSVYWGYGLFQFYKKELPALRDRHQKEHAKSKYIPGRKK